MTSFVLRFTGSSSLTDAVARLQRRLPGVVLTPKTSTLVEAQVNEQDISKLEGLADWDVSRPSFAEVPSQRMLYDWNAIKSKLSSSSKS